MDLLKTNAEILEKELEWFSAILSTRINAYFDQESTTSDIDTLLPPDHGQKSSVYLDFISHYNLGNYERIVLLLALVPHIKPQLLDAFFMKNTDYNRGYSEFGGLVGSSHSGFLPTGETAMFLVCGENLEKRFIVSGMFEAGHFFADHGILNVETVKGNEPILSGALTISNDFLELLTHGRSKKPNFNEKFPARLIATDLEWEDLVLEEHISDQICDIVTWIDNRNEIIDHWDLGKVIKPGYRALFYGPPGTGKTLAASLMAKKTGRDVYKVDLSMVVSKWVGETEKNLARIFDMAEHKDWILFFDEADALFGKRSNTKSSQERYANQEVAYLLQRTEDFPGIAILASNLKGNMDEAFARRFQSIIFFAIPKPKERLKLWTKIFNNVTVDKNVDFNNIAKDYAITGGGIVNVLKYCAIKGFSRKEKIVLLEDIQEGIRREVSKEGKTI